MSWARSVQCQLLRKPLGKLAFTATSGVRGAWLQGGAEAWPAIIVSLAMLIVLPMRIPARSAPLVEHDIITRSFPMRPLGQVRPGMRQRTGVRPHAIYKAELRSRLKALAPRSVLDVGCGD